MCDPQIVSGLRRGCSVADVALENLSPQTHYPIKTYLRSCRNFAIPHRVPSGGGNRARPTPRSPAQQRPRPPRGPAPLRARAPRTRPRPRRARARPPPPPFWGDRSRPEPVTSSRPAALSLWAPCPWAPRPAGPMCARPAPGRPGFASARALASTRASEEPPRRPARGAGECGRRSEPAVLAGRARRGHPVSVLMSASTLRLSLPPQCPPLCQRPRPARRCRRDARLVSAHPGQRPPGQFPPCQCPPRQCPLQQCPPRQ